jgi:hypothetical protein
VAAAIVGLALGIKGMMIGLQGNSNRAFGCPKMIMALFQKGTFQERDKIENSLHHQLFFHFGTIAEGGTNAEYL